MPTAKQLIGLAAPFGVVTTTAGWTGVIVTNNKVQNTDMRDEFDKANFMNGDGAIVGRAAYNRQFTLTLEVIFCDPSNPSTESVARSNTVLADMFALVTIAGSSIAHYDGQWNYSGGSYSGRQGEYHKYSLELWKGGAGTSPAALPLAF